MRYFIIGVVVLFLGSCDSFLEEYSQDMLYARTVSDLEEVLVGSGYVKTSSSVSSIDGLSWLPWLHLMDDDMEENCTNGETSIRTRYTEFHTWGIYPWMSENEELKDVVWDELYEHISVMNVLLSKLDEINDRPEDAERLRGECHFLRAYYYYFLVNLYAKPYSKTTANSDLGVPVKTTEYVEDIYFSRNTVGEVYAQIVEDLQDAIRYLRGKEKQSIYQANYYAAQALMSRVALYMGDYDVCINAADSVSVGGYSLLDYNTLPQTEDKETGITPVEIISSVSPETIFSQGGGVFLFNIGLTGKNAYKASEDLVNVLQKEQEYGGDLRYTFSLYNMRNRSGNVLAGFSDEKRYVMKRGRRLGGNVVSSEWLLKYPEVLLNKAEALVLLNREAEAIQIIEELRKNRIVIVDYQALPVKTGADLIELIREERRRELCFEGHRWFDLRRYAVHPEYPFSKEIVHEHYYWDKTLKVVEHLGTYKLKKYSEDPACYVLPIPHDVLEFNKGNMVDNEIRD